MMEDNHFIFDKLIDDVFSLGVYAVLDGHGG